MKTTKKTKPEETHPLFPSGQWEGFYTYSMGPSADQHRMAFSLNFRNGLVTGGGSDDIGGFTWKGHYDVQSMHTSLVKSYVSHQVEYQGHVDENGIWGTWTLQYLKGGFHIWPKADAETEAMTEVKEEEMNL